MRSLICGLLLLFLFGCHREYIVSNRVTVDEVVELTKAGKTPDEIIREIERSGTIYYLDTRDILSLHQEGVDSEVIEHMRRTPAKRR